ncbi:lytic transglycosylase domain-containing protein [Halorhodospira neutriphila]|uniref:Transglycosylase SLT domain-containing protein n=1 Tax=Halorhodospira neutriphila TaxID=168379 RepID=A0ABS1E768_9GAMM|nr:lytic transglycosylase domain-containing protein [Halorhodospira neutriphila]MBK1726659.1 hypothetical protein [Halorhodospira neutriphila]
MLRMALSTLLGMGALVSASITAHSLQSPPWESAALPAEGGGAVAAVLAPRPAALLPEVPRAVIQAVINAYQRRGRSSWLGSNRAIADPRLRRLVAEAAERSGLEPALIRAVARTESDYRPGVVSSAGAVGLMQIRPVAAAEVRDAVPEWAERVSRDQGISPAALAEPRLNLLVGSHYLARLRERYAAYGDPLGLWLALAAYNWGPGNVHRHLTSNPRLQSLKDLRWLLYRHAPHETRAFVQRVLQRSGLAGDAFREQQG